MERMDTYKTVKNLMDSGLLEKQAEAITTAINTSDNLATKEDIKDIHGEIRELHGEIRSLEKDIKHFQDNLKGTLEHFVKKDDLTKTSNKILLGIVASILGAVIYSIDILPLIKTLINKFIY